MRINSLKSSLLDEIAAIFFLVSSGSTFFFIGHQKMLMISFALFGCFYAFKMSRHIKCSSRKENLLLLLYLGIWPIINAVLFHSGSGFASTKPLFFGIGSYMIISYSNFFIFRKCLLKWMQVLLFVSIIVYLGYYYLGFPANIVELGDTPRNMCLYFFDVGFNDNYRLYSIYWEPGQCQIIVFYILALFMDELQDLKILKYNIKRFSIFIIAIILTASTTALITLIFLCAVVVMKSSAVRKNVFLIPLAICLVVFVGVKIVNSESVQEKFDNYGEEGRSATVRVMDNMAMLSMIGESPLIGHGMDTFEYDSLSDKFYNQTASNGWLNTCAEEGIPYLFVLIFAIYASIKRYAKIIPAYWILLILIISQAGEYALFLPITFLYVFKFASYSKTIAKCS